MKIWFLVKQKKIIIVIFMAISCVIVAMWLYNSQIVLF